MSNFLSGPRPSKVFTLDSPEYDPADHWGEDWTKEYSQIEPEICWRCNGTGIGSSATYFEPSEDCISCEGTGWDNETYIEPDEEEIDTELMGVEL